MDVNALMNFKDSNGTNNVVYPITKKSNVIGLEQDLTNMASSINSATQAVAGKVDKVEGKGLSTNDFTDAYKADLDGLDNALDGKADVEDLTAAQSQLNSLNDELSSLSTTVSSKASSSDLSALATTVGGKADTTYVNTELAKKVNKETGKGLSTNDYTTAEKNKLAGIAEGANKTTVDSELSSTSTNPVQNKAVNTALSSKLDTSTFNSYKTSNDTALGNKADKTYVDNELAKKADSSALTSKADASTVSALSETVATKADSSTVSAISDRVSATETEQETLSARMDTFAKLPEGSTTGDAELADGRVGADGKTYDNIGDAIRGQVTDLKSDLNCIKDNSYAYINPDNIFYVIGELTSNGEKNSTILYAIVSQFIYVRKGSKIKCDSEYEFNVAEYSDANVNAFNKYTAYGDEEYIVNDTCYIRIGLRKKSDTTELVDTSISNHLVLRVVSNTVKNISDNLYAHGDIALDQYDWTEGFIKVNGDDKGTIKKDLYDNFRICSKKFIKVYTGDIISVDDGYTYNYATYSEENENSVISAFASANVWSQITADGYIRVTVNTSPDNTIALSDYKHLHIMSNKENNSRIDQCLYDINDVRTKLENERYRVTDDVSKINFSFGKLNNTGIVSGETHTRVVSNYVRADAGSTIRLDSNDYKFNIAEYSDMKPDSLIKYRTLSKDTYIVKNDGVYIRFAIAADNLTDEFDDTSVSNHFIVNITCSIKNSLQQIENKLNDMNISIEKSSAYDRRNIADLTQKIYGYYKTDNSDGYDIFNMDTSYNEYITAFDTLIENHTNYITKTSLGKSSNDVDIYMYHLNPVYSDMDVTKKIPKILIISGQHGFEKVSPFGIYYFVRDLLTSWKTSPILDYIRNYVELKIIPMVNPYGIDNKVYKNANDVNINRNYETDWVFIDNTSSSDYGGLEPFDQPESQIVRDFVNANKDAVLFIDYHNWGDRSAISYDAIIGHNLPATTDAYCLRLYNASQYHHKLCTEHFKSDYLNIDDESIKLGRIAKSLGKGVSKSWVTEQGIIGTCLELTSGFKDQPVANINIKKAGAEFLGNFIMVMLNYLV